jgi:hypothetical protein
MVGMQPPRQTTLMPAPAGNTLLLKIIKSIVKTFIYLKCSAVGPDPDSMTLWIRIRDPDPEAVKMKEESGIFCNFSNFFF